MFEELKEVRNCHAAFHWGTLPGMAYVAASTMFLKGKEPWTLANPNTDSEKTGMVTLRHRGLTHERLRLLPCLVCSLLWAWCCTPQAKDFKPIDYPKPDGVLSFNLLDNLALSGTNHSEQVSARVLALLA